MKVRMKMSREERKAMAVRNTAAIRLIAREAPPLEERLLLLSYVIAPTPMIRRAWETLGDARAA